MTEMVEVRGVSKAYGGVLANDSVSLDVPEGRVTGLIGPNGSGKTTLFNSIVGYHPIDEGSIKFKGEEISDMHVQEIARLGLLRTFQQTRIYSKMNCVDNMLISAPHRTETFRSMFRAYPHDLTEKAESLLEFVGLYAKRRLISGDLSGGHQPDPDQRPDRPPAPRGNGTGGDVVRHRTQHAGDHESGRQYLLSRQRKASGPRIPERN